MSWEHDKWVSIMGKWAWIVAIIAGIVHMLYAIYSIIVWFQWLGPFGGTVSLYDIWNIVASIILILFALIIIKPRFSDKCANKDWDYLLDEALVLGSLRFPWMLVWAIITSILGLGWAGILIWIPAFVLLFAGPKKFEWKK